MEQLEIKEALNTVIMLSETARVKHTVEIDRIGKVVIAKRYAAMQTVTGKVQKITKESLEQCLEALLSESYEAKVKRRIQEMVFSGQQRERKTRMMGDLLPIMPAYEGDLRKTGHIATKTIWESEEWGQKSAGLIQGVDAPFRYRFNLLHAYFIVHF